MLELISPAGSPEGVIAAVQNGADAICLGFREFNACMDAENFTFDEFGRALEYCRVRGVKTYLSQDSLVLDGELPIVAENTREANHYGIDAIIVQDLGVMRAVKQIAPDVPVFAGVRMSIHNLEGAKMAAAMGMKRVTVAHELTRKEIYHICRYSPIEIEVAVHGHLCMCYSGQCYMSSLLGESSDSRGLCSKPCQRYYKAAAHEFSYPLSLKDNCLVRYLEDLEAIGVSAVSIEGRSKRPEYTALITGLYSKTARKKKAPSRESMFRLRKTFSRQGFTDGFYTDNKDIKMLGHREEDKRPDTPFFASTRKLYLNGEFQRVPIRFVGSVAAGKPAKLAAADDRKNAAVAYGPIPEQSFHRELTYAMLQTELYKTAGTPFICLGVKGNIEQGLKLPMSAFTDMRVQLFAEILEQRKSMSPRSSGQYTPSDFESDGFIPELDDANTARPTVITVSVSRADQLSEEMEQLEPEIVYIPISELNYESALLRKFSENEKITLAVSLPRIIHDSEKKAIGSMLERARNTGIREALVSNIGHIQFARNHGMTVRGDFGLNITNSESLSVLKKLNLSSATFSFELRLVDIRNINKPIDTELVTYGRLPLMYTENCIIRNCTDACTCDSFSGIEDEKGSLFPILPDYGCRNILLNSKKLFLADKPKATTTLGIWAQRLSFTTENAFECATILKRYMGQSNYSPQSYTRGVYFKDIEDML